MRDPGVIRALVLQRFTGNRAHDLIGFTISEFRTAAAAWDDEARRRKEALARCLARAAMS